LTIDVNDGLAGKNIRSLQQSLSFM